MKPKMKFNVMVERIEGLTHYAVTPETQVPVKIWLMHTGLNHNGTIIDKAVVESAWDSLRNMPILAYPEGGDFTVHAEHVGADGRLVYDGRAFGVVPADCVPKWEMRIGSDGVEREYTTVEGILWLKFHEATDILLQDGVRPVSMELHDSIEGSWTPEGFCIITKMTFEGVCMIGKDVPPAMEGATVELNFTKSEGDLKQTLEVTVVNPAPKVISPDLITVAYTQLKGLEGVINGKGISDKLLDAIWK